MSARKQSRLCITARRRWRRWRGRWRRWWVRTERRRRLKRRLRRLKPLWWRLGRRGLGLGPSLRLRRRWRHSHLDRLVWEEACLRARAFFGLTSPDQVGRLLCERGGLRPGAARAVALGISVTLTATEVEGLAALLSLPHGLLAALLDHRGTLALCAELHALDRRERFGRKAGRLAKRDRGLPCDPDLARAASRVAMSLRHLPALPLREDVAMLAFEALRLTVTGAEDEQPGQAPWAGARGPQDAQALLDELGTDEAPGDEGAPSSRVIVPVRQSDVGGDTSSGGSSGPVHGTAPGPSGTSPGMLFGYESDGQAIQASWLLADLLTEEEGEGAFSIGLVYREGLHWAVVREREGSDHAALSMACSDVAHQAPGLREEVW
jgi:hypothetical protein